MRCLGNGFNAKDLIFGLIIAKGDKRMKRFFVTLGKNTIPKRDSADDAAFQFEKTAYVLSIIQKHLANLYSKT